MRPWKRLAISDNWNHLSAYVIWNILVLNIKGKINKIVIIIKVKLILKYSYLKSNSEIFTVKFKVSTATCKKQCIFKMEYIHIYTPVNLWFYMAVIILLQWISVGIVVITLSGNTKWYVLSIPWCLCISLKHYGRFKSSTVWEILRYSGLSITGGTRYFYPSKMVFGTSWF
jgi:hypothetical protein